MVGEEKSVHSRRRPSDLARATQLIQEVSLDVSHALDTADGLLQFSMGSQFWTWLEAIIVMGVFAGVVAGLCVSAHAQKNRTDRRTAPSPQERSTCSTFDRFATPYLLTRACRKTSEELKKKGVMLSDSGVKIRGEGRAIASEDLADSMQRCVRSFI